MLARNTPGEKTKALRNIVEEQITVGVMAMDSGRVQELVKEAGVRYTQYAARVITDALKKHGWICEPLGSRWNLYFTPAIPRKRLEQCRASAKKALAKQMKELAAKAVAAAAQKKRELKARDSLKAEIIAAATSNRTPFDEYIFRAAQKCGLVRGYCWPQ